MSGDRFEALFGAGTEVVCAFHGYARALHQLLHGRPNPGRFHVHGYSEQGSTTTPFDMVVLNRMSRYHLVLNALRRAQKDIDLEPEQFKHYFLNELPEQYHELFDPRLAGTGERVVFQPYTQEIFERTYRWVIERGLFGAHHGGLRGEVHR